MSTFTPGPWKVVRGGDEKCLYIEQVVYGASGRGAVATVFTVHEKPTDTETADANLIASAPNLLTALKVMLDQVADDPNAGRFFDLRWLNSVRTLVAKAESRS